MISYGNIYFYIVGGIVLFAIVYKTVSHIRIRRVIQKTLQDILSLPSIQRQSAIDKIQVNLSRKVTSEYDCTVFAGTISFLILIFSILIRAIGGVDHPETQAPHIEVRIMLYMTYVFLPALVTTFWIFIAVIAHYIFKIWDRRILYTFEEKGRQLIRSEK